MGDDGSAVYTYRSKLQFDVQTELSVVSVVMSDIRVLKLLCRRNTKGFRKFHNVKMNCVFSKSICCILGGIISINCNVNNYVVDENVRGS